MRNKKGFVFIETIVTIVVLAVSLLYVYSSFNNILIKEKTRVHYDDVAYIYRTYYIKNFFAKYELNDALKLLSEDNPMIIVGCDYGGVFGEQDNAKYLCEELVRDLGISSIVVAINDLSYVKECDLDEKNPSYKCSYLNNISSEKVTYLETLGDLTDPDKSNKYVMIIEYAEKETYKVQNSKTGEYEEIIRDRYVHNYAWVRI